MKKLLSLALALLMILGTLTVGISATEAPSATAPVAVGYQTTAAYVDGSGNDVYDIRFAAVVDESVTTCGSVGFDITATASKSGAYTWHKYGNAVYETLEGTTPDGKVIDVLNAANYSAAAIIAITVTGVPADEEIAWTVTPFVGDAEGVAVVSGEAKTANTKADLYAPLVEIDEGDKNEKWGLAFNDYSGILYDSYPLSLGFDGDSSTRVATKNTALTATDYDVKTNNPYWFTIDFGKKVSIKCIADDDQAANLWSSWTFSTSTDGMNYTPVAVEKERDAVPADLGLTYKGTGVTFTFDTAIETRYLKITINHTTSATKSFSSWEMYFFTESSDKIYMPSEGEEFVAPLAPYKVDVFAADCFIQMSSRPLTNLYDGNESTRYGSAQAQRVAYNGDGTEATQGLYDSDKDGVADKAYTTYSNSWFYYDFGKVVSNIDTVKIYQRTAITFTAPSGSTTGLADLLGIWISNTGEDGDWTRVDATFALASNRHTITFDPVDARFVKVVFTQAQSYESAKQVDLYEAEVWAMK